MPLINAIHNIIDTARRSFLPLDTTTANLVQWLFNRDVNSTDGITDRTGQNTYPVQEGRCYDFNTSSQYVLFDDTEILGGTVAVSMWVKWDSFARTQFFLANNSADLTKNIFYLVSDTSNLIIGWRLDNAGIDRRAFFSLATVGLTDTNKFYHVVANIGSDGTREVFIDKVKFASNTTPFTIGDVDEGATIGGSIPNSSYFDGKIFDVEFYTNFITQTEVNTLFTHGDISDTNTPLTCYRMDEQAGKDVLDSCQSRNHGEYKNLNTNSHTTQTSLISDTFAGYSWQNQLGYSTKDYYTTNGYEWRLEDGTILDDDVLLPIVDLETETLSASDGDLVDSNGSTILVLT